MFRKMAGPAAGSRHRARQPGRTGIKNRENFANKSRKFSLYCSLVGRLEDGLISQILGIIYGDMTYRPCPVIGGSPVGWIDP